jgi:DNA-directed RNA polymerase subunit RPC12/RpoP
MFAVVTCPACQYKFSIPEGDMGKRHVCPNCRSPFFAGKSVAEAVGTASAPATASAPVTGANPSYAKTMLGETAPPIKYNCPRCKAPLEAPAIETGTKKPCPACGQRLQVPAAPPPAPAVAPPNLNKTMLASDESKAPPIKYNCPNCKKPFESPASEAGTKKNCPACGQRFQIPAAAPAPNLNKTILASDESKTGVQPGYSLPPVPAGAAGTVPAGQVLPAATPFTPRNLAIAAVVLLLLLIAVPAFIRGGKVEDTAALAQAKLELEKLKLEIAAKEKAFADQKNADDAERKKMFDRMEALIREQDALKRDKAAQEKWDQQKREMETAYQKLLEKNEARQKERERELQAALQAQQKSQTVIQQPPVIYYPPYHPRYYWPWGW